MTIEEDSRVTDLILLPDKKGEHITELSELLYTKALEVLKKEMNVQHPDSLDKDYPDTYFDHLDPAEIELISLAMIEYATWLYERTTIRL